MLTLCFRSRSFPLPFCFLSSASLPPPATWLSVSSFPLSSCLRLTVASSVRPLRFRFLGSPRSFRPGFPCLLSRFFVLGFLFVSFHPSRFRSHSRSTGASLLLSLSGFPLSFCFLSSTSVPVLTTQPSVLSFPFFPFSPDGGSSGAFLLFCPACFHAFLPIPVLSFLHFFSPLAVSPHSGYLSALTFSLSVPGLFPFAFALGSGYSALRCILSDTSPSLRVCSHLSVLTYTIMLFFDCQHLFLIFY